VVISAFYLPRLGEVRGLGFPGPWVKHSPPKRLRNASAVAGFGQLNPPHRSRSLRRVLDEIANRVGRADGQGTPVLWQLKPSFGSRARSGRLRFNRAGGPQNIGS
jgi:hypothetical protein